MTTLPRIGAWVGPLSQSPAAEGREVAQRLEDAGYGALWIGEAAAKEAFTHAGTLLAGTQRTMIATGIANLWVRDATTMVAATQTLAEAYPGRFLLGVGVSHSPLVDRRGHEYARPLQATADYLEAMRKVRYYGPKPPEPPQTVLAALGPKMLALAASHADGAHPYLVTPEHTAGAREVLGPDRLLAPVVTLALEADPEVARDAARRLLSFYLDLDNYRRHLMRQGFTEDDLRDGGSTRLVDEIVGWGSEEQVLDRVRGHLEAGADHVAVYAVGTDKASMTDQLIRLAPGLHELGA